MEKEDIPARCAIRTILFLTLYRDLYKDCCADDRVGPSELKTRTDGT